MQRDVICISSPRLLPSANTPNIQAVLGFLGQERWLVLSVCHRETNAIELEVRTGSHTPTFPTTSQLSSQPHTLPFFPSRKFFLECTISSKGSLQPYFNLSFLMNWASLVIQMVKNAGDPGSICGPGRPLEKGTATHSSILAWRIPWTEELAGCSPWSHQESDTTEQHFHFFFSI